MGKVAKSKNASDYFKYFERNDIATAEDRTSAVFAINDEKTREVESNYR